MVEKVSRDFNNLSISADGFKNVSVLFPRLLICACVLLFLQAVFAESDCGREGGGAAADSTRSLRTGGGFVSGKILHVFTHTHTHPTAAIPLITSSHLQD